MEDAWKAIMVNTTAALGRRPTIGGRQRSPAVCATKDWLFRAARMCGAGYAMAQIKEFATNCRLCAIEGTVVPRDRFTRMFNSRVFNPIGLALRTADRSDAQRDMLVQLSYIGRALPKGRATKEGLKAQSEHFKALGSRHPPLDGVRRKLLQDFSTKWANEHLRDFELTYRSEFDPSAGACLEFSRKQGGMAEYLRRTLHQTMGEIPRYLKKVTTYPVKLDDVALQAHSAVRSTLALRLRTIMREENYPRAKVLTISERGWKTRIVTKSPGCLVALAHHIRRWMASGIREDPAIREVLAGDHREAVESLFARPPLDPFRYLDESDQLILSADLKSATDLISADTYEAIVDGILASEPGKTLPPWAVETFRAATGPQILEYPDLGRFCTTKRGALMGLPTTWPLLCLANLAWWSIRNERIVRPPRVRICGDDLVAKASRIHIEAYESNAVTSGAKFSNRAKHMKLTTGGVFTEEVFFTTGNRQLVIEGPSRWAKGESWMPAGTKVARHERRAFVATNDFARWSDSFPTRGILGTMKSDLTSTDSPYWVALGPALEQMMRHRSPAASQRMLRAFRHAHPEFKAYVSSMGMASLIHVPRIFGGFGIPRANLVWNFRPQLAEPHQRMTVLAAKALALGTRPGGDFQQLARPWQDSVAANPIRTAASHMAEFGLESRYFIGSKSKNTQVPENSVAYPGEVHELLDRVLGNVARDLFFLGDAALVASEAKHRNSAHLLKTVRKRLNRERALLISEKGGWLMKKLRQAEKAGPGGRQAALSEIRDSPPTVETSVLPTPVLPDSWLPARGPEGQEWDDFRVAARQRVRSAVATERTPSDDGRLRGLSSMGLGDTPNVHSAKYLAYASEQEGLAGTHVLNEVASPLQGSLTWQDLIDRVVKNDLDRVALLLPREVTISSTRLVEIDKILSDPRSRDLLMVPNREWTGNPTKRVNYHLFGL
jgi:hypothetical protein